MTDARNAYRESAVRGASPVGQVILLYEQLVADLRGAGKAIDDHNISDRTNAINHAVLILGHLQNKLNFEVGGDVARHLERFYNLSRQRLIEAQVEGAKPILEEQIGLILNLRDAWIEVDRQNQGATAAPADQSAAAAETPATIRKSAEWSA